MEVASYCRFMMNLWWSAPGEEKQATALVKDAMEHAVTMARSVGRIDGHRFRLAIGGPLIRSRRIIEG